MNRILIYEHSQPPGCFGERSGGRWVASATTRRVGGQEYYTTASAITEWALSRKNSSSRATSAIYLHLHSSICFSAMGVTETTRSKKENFNRFCSVGGGAAAGGKGPSRHRNNLSQYGGACANSTPIRCHARLSLYRLLCNNSVPCRSDQIKSDNSDCWWRTLNS